MNEILTLKCPAKLNLNLTVKKICDWYETTNKTKNYLRTSEQHIKDFFKKKYSL